MGIRKSEMFYIIDDGIIKFEEGFECPPNDGYWWFPKLGFSSSNVFKEEQKAKEECIKICNRHINTWKERLGKINGN